MSDPNAKKLTEMTPDELRERIVELTAEIQRVKAEAKVDAARLDALQETLRHCPDAELGYNGDEDDDRPVGFYVEVGGCNPRADYGDTLRDAIDWHAKAMREGADN